MPVPTESPTRRDLLTLIGTVAGGAAVYQAMTSLGLAADSGYKGPDLARRRPRGAPPCWCWGRGSPG